MKISRLLIGILICITGASSSAQTAEELAQVNRVSIKLSALMKTLGPAVNTVAIDWKSNPEVAEIQEYSKSKRLAAVREILYGLEENDKKLFKKMATGGDHALAALLVRIQTYSFISGLIGPAIEEIGMKDFLVSEVNDLQLVFAQKITYEQYLYSKAQREDKLNYLLNTDKKILKERLVMRVENNQVAARLAAKTSAIALVKMCGQKIALCEVL